MLTIARARWEIPSPFSLTSPRKLSPLIVKTVEQVVRDIHDHGVAILLVEQSMRVALRLASRFYIMSKGKIVFHVSSKRSWRLKTFASNISKCKGDGDFPKGVGEIKHVNEPNGKKEEGKRKDIFVPAQSWLDCFSSQWSCLRKPAAGHGQGQNRPGCGGTPLGSHEDVVIAISTPSNFPRKS